ncbi:hypothetical protein PPL_07842 [Heterostelium album PN500]|uniref:PROP1-like PPR domain-containing protein n=1 Tax=Heterostelium pallidum (strain ATCC 26659 / Pp 5 / PN500) TaxID=670386 RepID=D3BH40_HETP5|nr:hypothetical protein PPL_07842 [Heterostelium album PN500]EFA79424.1 hypothetical protein PPL_07842 [Heterostelium album PN500]|eukprot:XP_020431545.1 hypothetical protein PPL_07842 [Heterostelium album PN500]
MTYHAYVSKSDWNLLKQIFNLEYALLDNNSDIDPIWISRSLSVPKSKLCFNCVKRSGDEFDSFKLTKLRDQLIESLATIKPTTSQDILHPKSNTTRLDITLTNNSRSQEVILNSTQLMSTQQNNNEINITMNINSKSLHQSNMKMFQNLADKESYDSFIRDKLLDSRESPSAIADTLVLNSPCLLEMLCILLRKSMENDWVSPSLRKGAGISTNQDDWNQLDRVTRISFTNDQLLQIIESLNLEMQMGDQEDPYQFLSDYSKSSYQSDLLLTLYGLANGPRKIQVLSALERFGFIKILHTIITTIDWTKSEFNEDNNSNNNNNDNQVSTSWEPNILGLPKRELLRELLPTIAKNRTLQRMVDRLNYIIYVVIIVCKIGRMSPPTEPYESKILQDSLQIDSFVSNIISGSFDLQLTIQDGAIGKFEVYLRVDLKFSQMSESLKILDRSLDCNQKTLKINIPFVTPLTGDTIFRISINRGPCSAFHNLVLANIDGQWKLEIPYVFNESLESLGYRIYRYTDDTNQSFYRYNEWTATDSYSIETLSKYFFGDFIVSGGSAAQKMDYKFKCRSRYGSDEERYKPKPTLEQLADIICYNASKLSANSVLIYFIDQNDKVFDMTIPSNEIGDYDPHKLIDLLKLGYQHFVDMEDIDQSSEYNDKQFTLKTTHFNIRSSDIDISRDSRNRNSCIKMGNKQIKKFIINKSTISKYLSKKKIKIVLTIVALIVITLIIFTSVYIVEKKKRENNSIKHNDTISSLKTKNVKNNSINPTIILSLDGFRYDLLDRGITPNLKSLYDDDDASKSNSYGVRADYMTPQFPTKTFPNLTCACYLWPGCQEYFPKYNIYPYIGTKSDVVIDQVIDWQLNEKPNLTMAYLYDVDIAGHHNGVDSLKFNQSIAFVDNAIGKLLSSLKKNQLFDSTNIIIVSDHGMTNIIDTIDVSSYINTTEVYAPDISPILSVYENDIGGEKALLDTYIKLKEANLEHLNIYFKKDIPSSLHYSNPNNERIAPLIAIADEGYQIILNSSPIVGLGSHGYSNSSSNNNNTPQQQIVKKIPTRRVTTLKKKIENDEDQSSDLIETSKSLLKKEHQKSKRLQSIHDRAPEDRSLSQKAYFEKLAKSGKFEEAEELLKHMPEERRTIYAYENLLLACAESGKFNQAWNTYNTMKKDHIKPTIYTLGHLINVCTTANNIPSASIQERVNKILNEIEKHEIKISVTFFNILMKTLVSIGKFDDALSFIDKMKAIGAKPDISTYTTYVVAMQEQYKTQQQFNENKRYLFERIAYSHDHQELDTLRVEGLKQIEKYTEIIQSLKRNNVQPDRYFVNTILHACKQTKYPEGVFDVYKTFKEMRFTQNLQSDTRTYDILISTCNYINKIDKGLELFEEMINKNIRPDISLINNLFRLSLRIASTKNQDIYDNELFIERIMKYMKRYDLLPNSESFTVLISTYAKQGKLEKVYELFLEMKDMNIKPNIKDYTGLITGLKDDIDKVMNVFRVIMSQGLKLTPEFVKLILSIVKRKGSGQHVEEISSGIRELEKLNK